MKRGSEQQAVESPKPPADEASGNQMIGLAALKKLKGRSLRELSVRGAQKLAAYSSHIAPPRIPSDSAFARLVDKKHFNGEKVTATSVADVFRGFSSERFFPVFEDLGRSAECFGNRFAGRPVESLIERADRIVDGRLDLLGYKGLDFGADISWRLDPVSGKTSDLKHWSLFDELDSDDTGDKKVVWEANRHQHFFTLGAAYALTGEERYAATFVRHIEGWMEQNPPELGVNWISSLEIAFRSVSWLWALNLFKDSSSLTPELRLKTIKHLYLHGRHIEKHLSLYFSANTHLTGEGLGLYYLGTQLGFLKCAERWRALGEEILLRELDRQVLGDGVYFEQSFWYQRYTTEFYIQFHILRDAFMGRAPDSASHKISSKIQSMAEFLLHVARPDGTTPMVGDDDGGRCIPFGSSRSDDFRAVLSTAAALFARGDFKYGAGQLLEETFWLLGEKGVEAHEKLQAVPPTRNSVAFKDGGYCVMRDGSTESDSFLLVDCGDLGALSAAHGHADALSFELAVAGRTTLVDSGTYTYHGSPEMRDFFRSSNAHNTLTVDGQSQSVPGHKFGWETRADACLDAWISEERFDFFEGAHDGYERFTSPVTHTRGILFLKNDYWIMRDFAETAGPHSYALNFHFNIGMSPSIKRLDDGNWVVDQIEANGSGLRLATFGDNGSWHQKESWISRNHGEKMNAALMRYVSNGAGPQEFFTFMLPIERDRESPKVTEGQIAGGRIFEIAFCGYTDLFAFCDTDLGISVGNFETDFRFSWVRIGASGEPEEFILVDGSKLSIDGCEVVDSPERLPFASVRVLGSQVNVRTSVSMYSIELVGMKNG